MFCFSSSTTEKALSETGKTYYELLKAPDLQVAKDKKWEKADAFYKSHFQKLEKTEMSQVVKALMESSSYAGLSHLVHVKQIPSEIIAFDNEGTSHTYPTGIYLCYSSNSEAFYRLLKACDLHVKHPNSKQPDYKKGMLEILMTRGHRTRFLNVLTECSNKEPKKLKSLVTDAVMNQAIECALNGDDTFLKHLFDVTKLNVDLTLEQFEKLLKGKRISLLEYYLDLKGDRKQEVPVSKSIIELAVDQPSILKKLIASFDKKDFEISFEKGDNLLHILARKNEGECVKTFVNSLNATFPNLLTKLATAKNQKEETPLSIAIQNRGDGVSRHLIRAGAKMTREMQELIPVFSRSDNYKSLINNRFLSKPTSVPVIMVDLSRESSSSNLGSHSNSPGNLSPRSEQEEGRRRDQEECKHEMHFSSNYSSSTYSSSQHASSTVSQEQENAKLKIEVQSLKNDVHALTLLVGQMQIKLKNAILVDEEEGDSQSK